MKVCQDCGKLFPLTIKIDGKYHNLCGRKFCLECSPFGTHNTSKRSRKAQQLFPRNRSEYQRVYVMARKRKMKEKAVKLLGGKCTICGYSKCLDALEFHHKDPNEKEFGIAFRYCCSWNTLKKEVKKCKLLCANCHREVEAEINKTTNYKREKI